MDTEKYQEELNKRLRSLVDKTLPAKNAMSIPSPFASTGVSKTSSITMGANAPSMSIPYPPEGLKDRLKRNVQEHKQVIETLEWFLRHVGLEPPVGLLVDEAIAAGLEILNARKR